MKITNFTRATCFIIAFANGLSGCSKRDDDLPLRLYQALEPAKVLTHGYTIIDLSKITTFPWDSVYFFQAETGEKHIMNITGINWNTGNVPNNYNRLVFVDKGQIIRYADLYRWNEPLKYSDEVSVPIWMYSYPCNAGRRVCARENAKFATFPACGEGGDIFYPLIPVECLGNFKDELANACYKKNRAESIY